MTDTTAHAGSRTPVRRATADHDADACPTDTGAATADHCGGRDSRTPVFAGISATATRVQVVRTFTLTGAPEVMVRYAATTMCPGRLEIHTTDGDITTLSLYGNGPELAQAGAPAHLEVHYCHPVAPPPAWLDELVTHLLSQ